jgi:hypothetical protein
VQGGWEGGREGQVGWTICDLSELRTSCFGGPSDLAQRRTQELEHPDCIVMYKCPNSPAGGCCVRAGQWPCFNWLSRRPW